MNRAGMATQRRQISGCQIRNAIMNFVYNEMKMTRIQ